MKFTEEKKIPGIIMLIDFEKALSWKGLYKCLKYLNFGESIRQLIKVLFTDISSAVIQSGKISLFGRGCRQSDPLTAYLFIICVELLAVKLEIAKH